MTKLKDCPFCGKDVPIDEARVFEAEDIGGWLAGCCAQTWGETREGAIAAWNTRSMTKTNTEAVEALKPCPLCRARPTLKRSSRESRGGPQFPEVELARFSCTGFGHVVSFKWVEREPGKGTIEDQAKSAWNISIAALSPTAKAEPSAAGLVEEDEVRRLLRAVYDDLPHTAISPALSKATGVPLGEVIPFDTAIACGWDFCGYERTIRAILAALSAPTREREQWRPIEEFDRTRASDGDEYLIKNDRGVFVGAWDPDWMSIAGTADNLGCGWFLVSDGKDHERPLRGDVPTQWLPLARISSRGEG
jgi:hypothetical protein